jgi:predicted DNA-binding transcriptional regulator AlpA
VSKHLLPAKEIRTIFGGVSQMTLWRWLHDESLGFPKPTVIRNRRCWDANEVEAFRSQMVGAGISKRAA